MNRSYLNDKEVISENIVIDPVSNNIWHCVPSNNFPMVYPCSDMGKDSSALILLFFDLSVFPKYVVLRFELSSDLVVLNISDCMPSYTSKYSSFSMSGVWPKSNSNISLSSSFAHVFFLHLFTVLTPKLW